MGLQPAAEMYSTRFLFLTIWWIDEEEMLGLNCMPAHTVDGRTIAGPPPRFANIRRGNEDKKVIV